MEDEDSGAEEVVVATFFDAARDGNEEEVARLSSQCSRLVSWSGDRGTALHEVKIHTVSCISSSLNVPRQRDKATAE